MIIITIRDPNRNTIVCKNYSELINAIDNREIADDDEILIVIQDNICLYSALGASHPITIDDLTGFFG